MASVKSIGAEKRLSPVVISDGCLHGWAFDALRDTLTVELLIDGQEVARALTGFKVLADFFATAVPPTLDCGFRIPLPARFCDGRTHALLVRIQEWAPLRSAPTAELHWLHGSCTGDWLLRPDGALEGWVAFVAALEPSQLPRVQLCEGPVQRASTGLDLQPVCHLPQFRTLARFRFESAQLEALRTEDLRVQCLNVQLPVSSMAATTRMVGVLEQVSLRGVRGWAFNASDLRQLLEVVVYVDEAPALTIRPHIMRHDVAEHLKLHSTEMGLVGFHAELPAVLRDGRPHQVVVRVRGSGTALDGCPATFCFRDQSFDLATAAMLLDQPAPPSGRLPPPVRRRRAPPQVTAVILNRNGESCLDGLLRSFEQHNSVPVHFIVIDHASTDGSLALLARWQSTLSLEVVALGENHSFSASCNRGAALARTPHLLFLNNDIVWVQDALPPLLESLRDRSVGLVGLRLHKTLGTARPPQLPHPADSEVQHLGVQFTLSDGHYWPFELGTGQAPAHLMHRAIDIAGVTGAVLLCRRADFLASGGFDEGYFYGYEDVEICLRWRERLGLSTVCRNDLIALHHHGYTRLTGREPSMVDHQWRNQRRLAQQLGIWIKRRYWQSLADGDGLFTAESLKVAFVIAFGHHAADHRQLKEAFALAGLLKAALPGVEPLFVATSEGQDRLGDCHGIIVLDPAFDLRLGGPLRADVRTALYVADVEAAEAWQDNPALRRYDRCLYPENLARSPHLKPLQTVLPHCPGTLAERLQGLVGAAALRVALHVEDGDSGLAERLCAALQQSGALAWVSKPGQPARIADVDLYCIGRAAALQDAPERTAAAALGGVRIALVTDATSALRQRAGGWFTCVWLLNNNPGRRLAAAPKGIERFDTTPQRLQGLARTLQRHVDKHLGRTFSPS